MTLVQRSNDARTLWNAVVSDIPAPSDRQFILWASRFSDGLIERALMKAGRKFAGQKMDPAVVHKYVTGLLLNLERAILPIRNQRMTDDTNPTLTTSEEVVAHLETAHANTPNPLRDLCEQLVREGDENTPLGDVKAILEKHYVAK